MEQETIAQTMLDQLVTDENSQMLKDLLPVCVYTYFFRPENTCCIRQNTGTV